MGTSRLWPADEDSTGAGRGKTRLAAASGPPVLSNQAGILQGPRPSTQMKSAKTILVVEDDFELRRVLCTALEQAGFRTVAAADGAEALRRLRSGEKADMI